MTPMRTWAAVSVAALLAAGISGCAATPVAAEPITLTIGTDDEPGVPAADQIELFAKKVESLSDGSITIEPKWEAAGATPDWDQAVAKLVIDGDLDLGLIPSRAWDSLGVTSLEPLNAPLLITSDAALQTAIEEQSDALMAGLPAAGVDGIALFPEGLRRIFGFDAPVLTRAEFEGANLRVPTSAVSTEVYAALGATTDDAAPDPSAHLARESSLLLVAGGAGPVTGNLVLYPKVNALVIGKKSAAKLNDEQRRILNDAAAATLDEVLDTQVTDVEAAKAFCSAGGTIVDAAPAELAQIEAAVAPVVAQIAGHGDNSAIIDALQRIAAQSPAAPIAACAGASAEPTGDQARLDGIYRFEWTEQEFRDAGISDQGFIDNNIGLWTWNLEDGTWTMHQTGPVNGTVTGTFWLVGEDTIIFKWPNDPQETYTWTANDRGDLTLTPIDVPAGEDAAVAMTGQVWERVD